MNGRKLVLFIVVCVVSLIGGWMLAKKMSNPQDGWKPSDPPIERGDTKTSTIESNTPPVEPVVMARVKPGQVMVVSRVDINRALEQVRRLRAEEREKVLAGRPTPFKYEENGGLRL